MDILLALLALFLGGVMKGATGAGAPVIATPALTLLFNIQTAVAVLVVPNMLSNIWQFWQFRRHVLDQRFLLLFAGSGFAGAILGTWFLVVLNQQILSLLMACAVIAFIALRLSRPDWILRRWLAQKLVVPVGLIGGVLQGATGISAPASLSFLNAMRLPRNSFIGTISVFFVAMSVAQLPTLWAVGLITLNTLALGLGSLVMIALGMPFGNWLARRWSARVFDRVMLTLLALLAAKILIGTLG